MTDSNNKIGAPITINDLDDEDLLTPPGWYTAVIVHAQIRSNRRLNGRHIRVDYAISESKTGLNGREVIGYHTIDHCNKRTRQRGRETTRELMRACGIKALMNADQLIGHRVRILVQTRPAKPGFPEGDEVKKIGPADDRGGR